MVKKEKAPQCAFCTGATCPCPQRPPDVKETGEGYFEAPEFINYLLIDIDGGPRNSTKMKMGVPL